MDFTTLASLAIIGAAVSAIVQLAKEYLSTTGIRVLVIVLSVLAATLYWFVRDAASFWTAFVSIIGWANTVYLFLVKPFIEE